MRELKLLIQKQAEMIDAFQHTIGKLESRIDDQTRRIGQLTDTLSQANRDNSELRGEILRMIREKDRDRNLVDSLRRMVSGLEAQLEDAKSQAKADRTAPFDSKSQRESGRGDKDRGNDNDGAGANGNDSKEVTRPSAEEEKYTWTFTHR